MYTLEQLQQKTFKELKEIGWQLNVFPAGDRRCRQNWIDALVGVKPPLLELLETSPGVEVYRVQEAIELALDEKLPSEEEALSIVAQYLISTSLREIRNAPPPATVFSPGQYVRIIEVVCRNSQFCGSIGIVAQHNFNVWVWVELDGGGRKIVICRPEKLQLIELVAEESVAKKEPIAQMRETSPGVEVEPVEDSPPLPDAKVQRQEPPIENSPRVKVERTPDYLDCPSCGAVHALYATAGLTYPWEARCIHCNYVKCSVHHPFEYTRPFETPLDRLDFLPIAQVAEKLTLGGADGNTTETDGGETYGLANLCADSHHARFDTPELHGSIGGIESRAFPNQKSDRVLATARDGERDKGQALRSQPIELTAGFNDEQPPNRGDNGRDRLESAIGSAAKKSPGVDRSKSKTSIAHQLLELFKSSAHIIEDAGESEAEAIENSNGVTFSSRFLTLYSPPQSENTHYKADADGQLSLLDFEIESTDEPPDPDDFESLDAFRKAIALWDSEHSEPSSEHCGFSSEHNEPLSVLLTSLDSMCEWAPCPLEWYEPETNEINETVSRTLEVSPTIAISDTSEFSIPTFDVWCDRPNDTDEPPDTGIFARLPKPKPPSFPPMVVAQGDRSCKKFARSATILSGRSPPGGDPMN